MKPVIFDTDIGIDDAMALLFLHYAPEVDLKAIITGFGNASVANTTRNALHVKQQFGISAPVYVGADKPIGSSLTEGYPDFVHGKNGLGDIDFADPEEKPEETEGAKAIVELAQRHEGQLTIVAVGRMTNVAKALALCPELPDLIDKLIVMGGAFGFNGHRGNVSPVAEANISGDAAAADIVFNSGMSTTIVGLDVTNETIMSAAYIDELRRSAGSAGEFLYQITRFYLDFNQNLTGRYECSTHDPSAVAFLLQPDLFETRDVAVRVATEGIAKGQTIWGDPARTYATDPWNDRPSCSICVSVDDQRLLNLFRETLCLAAN